MEITIVKNPNSTSLFAVPNDSIYALFQFEWRSGKFGGEKGWYFWPRGNYDPQIFKVKKKDFPMDYFINLCRAKSFILNPTDLNQEVIVTNGENFIGLK